MPEVAVTRIENAYPGFKFLGLAEIIEQLADLMVLVCDFQKLLEDEREVVSTIFDSID